MQSVVLNFCFIDQVPKLLNDMSLSPFKNVRWSNPYDSFMFLILDKLPCPKPSSHTYKHTPRVKSLPQISVTNAELCQSDFYNQDHIE